MDEILLAAIDAAPIAVAVFDGDMRYLAASRAWLERKGVVAPDHLGRPSHLVGEPGYEPWMDDASAALKGAVPPPRRSNRVESGGRMLWERSEVRCWQAADPATRGVVVCIADITAEEESARAHARSERTSDLLQEMSHTGLWRCSLLDGRIYWSEETRRILGLVSADAADYQAYLTLIHPADREAVARHWQSAVDPTNAGTRFEIEHRIVVDVDIRWVRKAFVVERQPDGSVCGVTGVLQDISAIKRRNAQVRLDNSRLRGLFGHIGLGAFIVDRDGCFIDVNDEFGRISGYSASELVGRRRWSEVLDAQLGAPALSLSALADGSEPTLVAEGPFQRADGKRIWGRISAFAIRDGDGSLLEIAATLQDITESKAQAAALMESEARFRGFFNALGVGAARLDPDWTFRDVNDAFCEMVGYSRSELVGNMNSLDLSPPEDRPEEEARRARYFLPGEHHRRYYKRFKTKQGAILEIRVTATATFDEQGVPQSIIGIMENISELERMQNALLDSERKLRLAIDAADLGVWEFDPQTGDMFWNKKLCQLLGYDDRISASYSAWQARVVPEDREAAEAAFNKSFRNGLPFTSQFRVRNAGDEVRWLEAHGRCILDRDGRAIRSYGVVFDETERKQKEVLDSVLLAELNHRAKNLLSVVQGIAFQTAWDSGVPDFYPAFSGRLFGLAASHDLLVRTGWAGVDLQELAQTQLSHLQGMMPERIRIEGPQITLRPSAAQAIGMAIHELGTNAVKYGALSGTGGSVSLKWRVYPVPEAGRGGSQIEISWIESGGPLVKPPKEQGFGYSVLVTTCEHLFESKVHLNYNESGLTWVIDAELDKLRANSIARSTIRNDNGHVDLRGQA